VPRQAQVLRHLGLCGRTAMPTGSVIFQRPEMKTIDVNRKSS
jgi:hypothetical protein